jgi:hypothetical protein
MGTFRQPRVGSRRQTIAAARHCGPVGAAVACDSQPKIEESNMRQHFWKPALLTMTAIAMTALTPVLVSAQDRPDDRKPDEHKVMKADDHRDDHKNNDDHRNGDDQVQQYRHDHPRSSARCHDGFFTTTKDRNRACTKHGGIDVWLSL